MLSIYFNKSKGIHQRISQSKQNVIRTGNGVRSDLEYELQGYESFMLSTEFERGGIHLMLLTYMLEMTFFTHIRVKWGEIKRNVKLFFFFS